MTAISHRYWVRLPVLLFRFQPQRILEITRHRSVSTPSVYPSVRPTYHRPTLMLPVCFRHPETVDEPTTHSSPMIYAAHRPRRDPYFQVPQYRSRPHFRRHASHSYPSAVISLRSGSEAGSQYHPGLLNPAVSHSVAKSNKKPC